MKKKLLPALLALVMVLSLLPVTALAAASYDAADMAEDETVKEHFDGYIAPTIGDQDDGGEKKSPNGMPVGTYTLTETAAPATEKIDGKDVLVYKLKVNSSNILYHTNGSAYGFYVGFGVPVPENDLTPVKDSCRYTFGKGYYTATPESETNAKSASPNTYTDITTVTKGDVTTKYVTFYWNIANQEAKYHNVGYVYVDLLNSDGTQTGGVGNQKGGSGADSTKPVYVGVLYELDFSGVTLKPDFTQAISGEVTGAEVYNVYDKATGLLNLKAADVTDMFTAGEDYKATAKVKGADSTITVNVEGTLALGAHSGDYTNDQLKIKKVEDETTTYTDLYTIEGDAKGYYVGVNIPAVAGHKIKTVEWNGTTYYTAYGAAFDEADTAEKLATAKSTAQNTPIPFYYDAYKYDGRQKLTVVYTSEVYGQSDTTVTMYIEPKVTFDDGSTTSDDADQGIVTITPDMDAIAYMLENGRDKEYLSKITAADTAAPALTGGTTSAIDADEVKKLEIGEEGHKVWYGYGLDVEKIGSVTLNADAIKGLYTDGSATLTLGIKQGDPADLSLEGDQYKSYVVTAKEGDTDLNPATLEASLEVNMHLGEDVTASDYVGDASHGDLPEDVLEAVTLTANLADKALPAGDIDLRFFVGSGTKIASVACVVMLDTQITIKNADNLHDVPVVIQAANVPFLLYELEYGADGYTRDGAYIEIPGALSGTYVITTGEAAAPGSSSSSESESSSTPSTPSTPTTPTEPDTPTEPEQPAIPEKEVAVEEVAAAVDETTGKATAEVTEEAMDKAVEDAIAAIAEAEAKEEEVAPVVSIPVKVAEGAKSVDVKLPAKSVEKLAEQKNAALEVKSDVGEVKLDNAALKALAESIDENSTITLEIESEVAEDELTAEQIAAIGEINNTVDGEDGDAELIDVTLYVNDQPKGDFGGGEIEVTVPAPKNVTASNVRVYYLNDQGKLERVPGARVVDGKVKFKTNHLSKYIITSKALTAEVNFTDVPEDAWYLNELAWAASKNIAKGLDEAGTMFGPGVGCTRAQFITFLWRACGEPKVEAEVKFTDVDPAQYSWAMDAIKWGVANKIITGMDDEGTIFEPETVCTRAQAVTMMYRADGQPDIATSGKFTDVPEGEYYTNAVAWAVAMKITEGATDTTFEPGSPCIRAQMVVFLYRMFNGTGVG